MHNEEQTAGTEQVSQHTLEAILNLANSGSSPEDLSIWFGLNVQMVHRIIANDPTYRARVVQSIIERSAEFRCTLSKRLMVSPVMARDGNFYEQSILEANPSLSDQFMPSPKLKAKIAVFSKESLTVLERYLQQKDPHEDILELTAECLSVLSPDVGMESVLRALGAVKGETVKRLIGKLRGKVSEAMLLILMNQLARELPFHGLCLATLIILEPRSERGLEDAVRGFTELLSQVALNAGAIDLAEEVSGRLSSSQLSRINTALRASPSEGGDRLDGLRLSEAYALLREGSAEAAIGLVNTLRVSPCLEKEVLRFYDEAGLSSGKVPILEQRLSAKLEEISRDSPPCAEALSILHQLLNAELQSRKSVVAGQPLISLKAETLDETLAELRYALIAQDARTQRLEEQTQRKEAAYQETLASLRAKVEALTEGLIKTGQAASQTQIAQAAAEEVLRGLRGEVLRLNRELAETMNSLQDTREALYRLQAPPLQEAAPPAFIYSYKFDTDQLHRTNLVTGEQSSHRVPSYQFKSGCCWSEVPGGGLHITGGGSPTAVREVVRVDVRTFGVSPQPPMYTPRRRHAAVYHAQHLYVLGGYSDRYLRECERYVCAENRWQALPPLPRACKNTSGVVVESSLYALGGHDGSHLDLVQKLSLGSLTWEVMQLRLPHAGQGIPCFKARDTEVYLVVNKTLCSFTGLQVRPCKTPTLDICSWYGASYYHRGALYCSNDRGGVRSYEIGSLSNYL
jgi:hypothetical protein